MTEFMADNFPKTSDPVPDKTLGLKSKCPSFGKIAHLSNVTLVPLGMMDKRSPKVF